MSRSATVVYLGVQLLVTFDCSPDDHPASSCGFEVEVLDVAPVSDDPTVAEFARRADRAAIERLVIAEVKDDAIADELLAAEDTYSRYQFFESFNFMGDAA